MLIASLDAIIYLKCHSTASDTQKSKQGNGQQEVTRRQRAGSAPPFRVFRAASKWPQQQLLADAENNLTELFQRYTSHTKKPQTTIANFQLPSSHSASPLPLFWFSTPAVRAAEVVMATGSQYVACMQSVASRKRTAHTGGHGNTPPCGSTSFPETLWLEPPPLSTSPSLLPDPLRSSSPSSRLQCCICVQLPACSLESSPGPGRRSSPLRCGMLLWSLHSWWGCLDWASTGDTWPSNTQNSFSSVQHKLNHHKYTYVIYCIRGISDESSLGICFSPDQHNCCSLNEDRFWFYTECRCVKEHAWKAHNFTRLSFTCLLQSSAPQPQTVE